MSQEHVQQFIKEAIQTMQTGHYAPALELLEQAIALDQQNGGAHTLRGIALAQLNRPDEATEAFLKGIGANPSLPKAHYNYAVHLYQMGNIEEAKRVSKDVLSLNPDHAGAKGLLSALGQPVSSEGLSPQFANSGFGDEIPVVPPSNAASEAIRPGYETREVGSVKWVENLGAGWVIIGLVLSVGSLAFGSYNWIIAFASLNSATTGTGDPDVFANLFGGSRNWQSAIPVILGLTGMVWMIIDLVHRRGNWLWLLPYILCCCCNFGGFTQLVYIWQGRK